MPDEDGRLVIVVDRGTLFLATVGRDDADEALLVVALSTAHQSPYYAATTEGEFAQARTNIERFHEKHPEKFSKEALEDALIRLELLSGGAFPNFQVRPDVAVSSSLHRRLPAEHLLLLTAAVNWEADFFCTHSSQLLRMEEYANVRIATPTTVLDELPSSRTG